MSLSGIDLKVGKSAKRRTCRCFRPERSIGVARTRTATAEPKSEEIARPVFRIGSARGRWANAADGIIGSSEATDLGAQRLEKGLRLGEFGELSGRREVLDRRRQHGVRIGVATGRVIKLRQRQCGAQFEAEGLLRLRNCDRGLQ